MSRKLYTVFSLLVIIGMFLAACAGGPQGKKVQGDVQPAAGPEVQPTQPTAAGAEPVVVAPAAQPKTTRLGGWLDSIVFSAIPDPEPAVAQIQAGAIDLYSATIDKADVFAVVEADPKLGYKKVYGSNNQLLLNPVTCSNPDLLNPFTSARMREAMNWAIDRNYIVQEIFGGLARAKYTPFTTAFPDYARYSDLFSVIEARYAYNFEKAVQVVDEEMPKLGATKGTDGVWQYKGKPVTIIGLIRTEDKRKEIGEYFSNQLEKLGFKVDRQEKVRKEASPIWQGDPEPCGFHFYTAGWVADQIARDEGGSFIQYNTGLVQNLPVFNAYQPSEALFEVSEALYNNSFNNMDERRELFKTALSMSMEESWWGVWVNDSISFVAFNGQAQGASDLAAGIGGSLYPFTARWANQEGGTLRIANSAILVDAWNPIDGSTWVDDSIPRNFTVDYGIIPNPYTGLVIPKLVERADLVVQENVPVAQPQGDWLSLSFEKEIPVPGDAWVDWDATNQVFITAAEKAKASPDWQPTAKTKVTVVYTPELWDTTWHDGNKLTLADFVFAMIMNFDLGKPESKIYDESLVASVDSYLSHFKGVRIVATDPLTIETYDDLYYVDAEDNVVDWYPNKYRSASQDTGMFAWHALTPAIQAEADGKMAFSKSKSTDKEIDYTSQASGPTLEVQMAYLEQDLAGQYIPYAPTLSQYITPEEAVTRYTNLKAFYEAHKHLVLGTGPYMVDRIYPVEQSISLLRYEDYLFPADQFADFGKPQMVDLLVDGPTMVMAGSEAAFNIDLSFEGQPYLAENIDTVAYILFNTDNNIAVSGTAELISDGQYEVVLGKDITAKLNSGTARLTIAVTSKVVSLPAMETIQFRVKK